MVFNSYFAFYSVHISDECNIDVGANERNSPEKMQIIRFRQIRERTLDKDFFPPSLDAEVDFFFVYIFKKYMARM